MEKTKKMTVLLLAFGFKNNVTSRMHDFFSMNAGLKIMITAVISLKKKVSKNGLFPRLWLFFHVYLQFAICFLVCLHWLWTTVENSLGVSMGKSFKVEEITHSSIFSLYIREMPPVFDFGMRELQSNCLNTSFLCKYSLMATVIELVTLDWRETSVAA